jgi:DNA-binding LytR/AlgR family response regulator
MFRILIIEDEAPARRKLNRFLERNGTPYQIVAELETIAEASRFLANPGKLDLIFSDIELLDGNVFSLYDTLNIQTPVIFTTAYNAFLMDAFEANGIEYLLKPFSFERFQKAWDKFLRLGKQDTPNYELLLGSMQQLINQQTPTAAYKTRFAIKKQQETYFLSVPDIVYFQADEGIVYAFDQYQKKHIMPFSTLKEIEEHLDPKDFFRINRSQTLQKSYIEKLERYSKNAMAIHLQQSKIVLKTSQNKTADFNQWIEQ